MEDAILDKNKRHFEENFQDSDIDTLYNEIKDEGDQIPGEPVQLIKFQHYGRNITVDDKAIQIISSYDVPVGFVSLVGKYRTGKSFLLNKLLMLEDNRFKVDSSTKACTQGIWMWSKPFYNENYGNYIFFLDTEGCASLNRDSDTDAKIFTLATLISSYLIYNSVGAIDQRSISELNLATQLSKNIMLENNVDLRSNQENLYRFMPKFLWLLRDFVLEPQNAYGKKLTPNEYLEDALTEQNTQIKNSDNSKKIRRALLKYFKDRQCVTLVRPARQEHQIQNLNDLPSYSLRRQFSQGISKLREKIMKNAGPKTYNQTPLYGSSIGCMLQSYVNAMNEGAIPNIQTAWESINDDEGGYAYEKAIEQYNELYQQNFQEDEPKGEEIHTILRALREASLNEFKKNLTQSNDGFETKLKEFLNENEDKILQVNKQLIQQKNIQILKESTNPLMIKIEANAFHEDPQGLTHDVKKAVTMYNQKARGENKGEILSQFLELLNPIILQIQKKHKSSKEEVVQPYKEQQYEETIKALKQQIKSLERQNKANQSKLNKGMENTKINQDPKRDPRKEAKKKKNASKAGCGDCQIM